MAAVAGKLTDFLTSRQAVMSSISQDIDPLMGSISNLVTGGKRLRALMCYWGWRGAGGEAGAAEVVTAGSALELFQAAALIHDDIIDRSDTRRGGPASTAASANCTRPRAGRWTVSGSATRPPS